eukprot:scaffold489_cov309-Pavlova_lutheri.AAC.7
MGSLAGLYLLLSTAPTRSMPKHTSPRSNPKNDCAFRTFPRSLPKAPSVFQKHPTPSWAHAINSMFCTLAAVAASSSHSGAPSLSVSSSGT